MSIRVSHATFASHSTDQANVCSACVLTFLAFILLSYPKGHTVLPTVAEWLGDEVLLQQLSLMTHGYFFIFYINSLLTFT